jgi:hypothetical protein
MIIMLLKSINLRFSNNSFTTNHAWNFPLDFWWEKEGNLTLDVLEMGESIVHEWGGSRKWVFLPYSTLVLKLQIGMSECILKVESYHN